MARVRLFESDAVGYAIGGLGSVAVAAALVPVREDIVGATGALVLVLVVVLAAIAGGRGAGAFAAVAAALSFDFFLTRPYLALRIDSADDVETTIVLLVIGLVVGQIVVLARRARAAARRTSSEIERLHRVAEQAATGTSADDLVLAVAAELTALLSLRDCRFVRPPYGPPLPRLERNGAVTGVTVRRFAGDEFALPEEGVDLPVLGRGREVGRFVLDPDPDAGASLEERVVAVALSDQLGGVLAAEHPTSTSSEET